MKDYKRKITGKLLALRIVSVVLILLLTWFSLTKNSNIIYLIGAVVIAASLINVNGFEKTSTQVIVTRYYFFSIWKSEKRFNMETLQLIPFDIELTADEDAASVGHHVILNLLIALSLSPKATITRYTVNDIDKNGRTIKTTISLLPGERMLFANKISQFEN